MVDTYAWAKENCGAPWWFGIALNVIFFAILHLLVSMSAHYAFRGLILYRIDMNGALLMDVVPNFRLPSDMLHLASTNTTLLLPDILYQSLISISNSLSDVLHALNSLAKLVNYLNENQGAPGFWTNEMVYFKNVLPVTHEVLELPRYNFTNSDTRETQVLREAIRRSCLLWLAMIKRRFVISPDGVLQHRDMLYQFLSEHPIQWESQLQPLRLWISMTLAVAWKGESASLHMANVLSTLQEMKISCWTESIGILKSIAWVDEIGKDEFHRIREQIYQIEW